jgi:serine/threonine-protein kinase
MATATSAPTETSAGDGTMSSTPAPESRFIPGTVLAKRYRIVGLLGVGGMGEVYRADDLKLGQPVALKFLPQAVERNQARLERFLNEVRTALKVSHPNVCRVHDIGEIEGQHYLSMEYVDGEDLASLLRRIGRLPEDKAVQLSRQICAGLMAAHEQGILHRDLKPANVMIDGRGRAKITDFGLASLAEGIEGAEARVGTPAYMAPEQLAGREVTVQSDIYALGLVLYELFTGKMAYKAKTPEEIAKLQIESTPTSPSSHVSGLDPAVERVILRCLESRPEERPASVMAVAAALPGGDPLAAALAAGETPSPEMVAAAGPRGGLKLWQAGTCLALMIVGIILTWIFMETTTLHSVVPMPKSFDVLREDAREIAHTLGYEKEPCDSYSAYGFSIAEYMKIGREDEPWAGWESLSRPQQTVLYFFYRQRENNVIVPSSFWSHIKGNDPRSIPGDITMRLNLKGELFYFQANPVAIDPPIEPEAPLEVDWSVLFDLAGLDMESFEEASPTVRPPLFADTRAAWTGVMPGEGERPVRIEAAACDGKPVYFLERFSYDPEGLEGAVDEEEQEESKPVQMAFAIAILICFGGLLAGALLLVIRNLALGRGDRRGAFRISMLVFGLLFVSWLVSGHHVPSPEEATLVLKALARSASLAVLAWLLYITLEPYIRRFWPEALVAWNRLIAGRFNDPLVGRDVLVGFAISGGLYILLYTANYFAIKAGVLGPFPFATVEIMQGGRHALGRLLTMPLLALFSCAAMILGYMILRVVLRRHWLAATVFCLLFAATGAMQYANIYVSGGLPAILFGLLGSLASAAIVIFILIRFGVVAFMASYLFDMLTQLWPLTFDLSSPFFGTALLGPLVLIALGLYAFKVSLAGRPLFKES